MVHRGLIGLPSSVKLRCLAMLTIGQLAEIISSEEDMQRAHIVYLRIIFNSLLMTDLQDLQRLANGIVSNERTSLSMIEDITELAAILDLFIVASAAPTRPCGVWSAVSY